MYSFNYQNRRAWVKKIALEILPGKKVLDVGAGSGQYRDFFSHCIYMTQDFGQEPATIGKYTPLDFVSDIIAIPAESESFDVILCTEVIEHVPDPILAVKEMARLLKPGGKIYLTAPLGSSLHQEPFHFYGGYTPYWYQKFLPASGIEIISIEKNMGFFSFLSQESQRSSALMAPWRLKGKTNLLSGSVVTLLWLVMLPFTRLLLPLFAKFLDDLRLENETTVGYHVIGQKK